MKIKPEEIYHVVFSTELHFYSLGKHIKPDIRGGLSISEPFGKKFENIRERYARQWIEYKQPLTEIILNNYAISHVAQIPDWMKKSREQAITEFDLKYPIQVPKDNIFKRFKNWYKEFTKLKHPEMDCCG